MKILKAIIATLSLVFSTSSVWAQAADSDGYISLFNGNNLDGWVNVNGKPDTWQVRDGLLICSGEPNGFIRNNQMYENYILEVEWRHAKPGGNSGIFFHADASPRPGEPYPPAIEAQLLDGDHGSLFGIRGASLVALTHPNKKGQAAAARPLEKRQRPAEQWNQYVITSKDGTVELAVNGKVVTRAKKTSRVKGYIGLQAEHSEVHFRKIRIRPLPSSNPPIDKIAKPESDAWKAGVASVVITPPNPMWMSGYAGRKKPASQTEHDLHAKVLIMEDPYGKRAVLVTLDLVGIDRATTARICQTVAKRHSLNRDQIALNCSHTHSGPVVGHNLRGLFFHQEQDQKMIDAYTEWLRDRIVSVVDEAMAKLTPATLAWGEGISHIAVNRRNNPHPKVKKRRAEGKLVGPSDYSVPVLLVKNFNKQLIAIVAGYACHPTKLSGAFDRWCGDYPGFAKIELEKKHPGAIAMFWQGCGGDQTPWPRGDTDVETARNTGKQLAAAIEKRLKQPLTIIKGNLKTVYQEIDLPLSTIPERKQLEVIARGKNKYKARHARKLLEDLETGKSAQKSYPAYPIQTWRLGSELQWIFLGGEVVVDYSLRFKKEFGESPTWVTAYTNDVMAYIPSERVLEVGGYEGGTSMVYYGLPAPWKPGIENLITDEVRRQVQAALTKPATATK
ncbi:MAG: neutral/alkaline non-lysosomal ceramidase N-terminal domain-containing protein [Verrucomicrobiota bacterium]